MSGGHIYLHAGLASITLVSSQTSHISESFMIYRYFVSSSSLPFSFYRSTSLDLESSFFKDNFFSVSLQIMNKDDLSLHSSLDLLNSTFLAMHVQSDVCKAQMVCMVEARASQNPIFRLVIDSVR